MNKLLINFIKETAALSRCFLILAPKKCQIGAVCIDRWAADSLDTGQVADNNFCRPGDKWNWRQTTKAADWSRRFVSGSLRGHETRRPYIKSTSWKVLVTFIFLWITIKVDWFNFKWIGVRQRLDWLFNGPTNVLRMWVNRRPSCRSSERKVFGGVGRFHRPGFPPLTLTSTSEGFRPIRQFLSFTDFDESLTEVAMWSVTWLLTSDGLVRASFTVNSITIQFNSIHGFLEIKREIYRISVPNPLKNVSSSSIFLLAQTCWVVTNPPTAADQNMLIKHFQPDT